MKYLLKTAVSLLADQVVGIISGFMLILCVSAIFKNSLTGYIIAFCICFGFYIYVTYLSAFKSGFHDSHRVIKDTAYRGYLYKGALAGLFSAIPLLIIYIIYKITNAGILAIYFMIANMFWTWPMSNIFPNHIQAVFISAFVPLIIIPWLGYIAGYRNFLFSDQFMKIYRYFKK